MKTRFSSLLLHKCVFFLLSVCIYHILFHNKTPSFPRVDASGSSIKCITQLFFFFFNHNWSYLWLSVSSASWNTPAAVWLGLTLNNDFLVNITHRAVLTKLTNASVAILTGKKKYVWLAENRRSPPLSGCLLFQNVEGELRSLVRLLAVFLCQACRGSSCVLAAPVMLWLLAVTCGSMWGSCRSTQQRRQEGDLLCSQLFRPAVIVLWRRVGEAV